MPAGRPGRPSRGPRRLSWSAPRPPPKQPFDRFPDPPRPPQLCKDCFYAAFEAEVHETIASNSLFKPGDRVAIGASGGKDSTVLAYLMGLLNERHRHVPA